VGLQWKSCADDEAANWMRTGFDRAAVHRHALAHTREPVTAGAVLALRRPPVVRDLEVDGVPAVADGPPRVRGPCVLDRVRQRLLDDPVGGEVEAGRELDRVALDCQLDGEPGPLWGMIGCGG